MHRYVLACLLGVLSIAACASQTAMAVAQTSDGYLLRLICDARNVKESTCAKAKGYPDGRACNVELQETRAEGTAAGSEKKQEDRIRTETHG